LQSRRCQCAPDISWKGFPLPLPPMVGCLAIYGQLSEKLAWFRPDKLPRSTQRMARTDHTQRPQKQPSNRDLAGDWDHNRTEARLRPRGVNKKIWASH
jgi:hypothetical protein